MSIQFAFADTDLRIPNRLVVQLGEMMERSEAEGIEHGAYICRTNDGTITLGPTCAGDSCSVRLTQSCPDGTTAIGMIHTHPKAAIVPSNSDMRTALSKHFETKGVLRIECRLSMTQHNAAAVGDLPASVSRWAEGLPLMQCSAVRRQVERGVLDLAKQALRTYKDDETSDELWDALLPLFDIAPAEFLVSQEDEPDDFARLLDKYSYAQLLKIATKNGIDTRAKGTSKASMLRALAVKGVTL